MILEKYFEIIDRPSEEVSKYWKVTHIVFLALGGITGLTSSLAFAMASKQYSENCFLFPKLAFRDKSIPINLTLESRLEDTNLTIDLRKTHWGDVWTCDYCTYVPLMSVILGAIFITFFMMLPRGGTSFSQTCSVERAYYLIIPAVIITGIYSIIILTSLFKLLGGLDAFCAECEEVIGPKKEMGQKKCFILLDEFADETMRVLHGIKNEYYLSVSVNISFAILLVGASSICWMCAFISLIVRILFVADFKIIEVVIQSQDQTNLAMQQPMLPRTTDSDSDEITTVTVEG